jgi:replicative DNA helicase
MTPRVLPHNLDAEASVLGGVILRNDVLTQLETLEVEDFYDHRHKAVFQAIRNLETAARPIDVVTLEVELAKLGRLDAIGGVAFLGELALRVPTADNVVTYASIVTDKHRARRMMLAASEIVENGYGDLHEVRDYLDDAEAKVFEITQRQERSGPEPVRGLVKRVFGELEERLDAPDGVTGVPTGFAELDARTAGLQPTELTILAARPAMGKTAFAMSIAQHAAIVGGWPCLVFSLEMSSTQLVERMLCSEARVDSSALRRGQLQRTDMTNLSFAARTIARAPILIDDTPALSLREVARARASVPREQGVVRRPAVRPDRRRLPPAHARLAGDREGEPRTGDQRDLARPQGGSRRSSVSRPGALSAQPRRGDARPATGRSSPTCASRARWSRTPT